MPTITACDYCGLPTPVADDRFHEICRTEVGPLTSCPDQCAGTCPACNPTEDQ